MILANLVPAILPLKKALFEKYKHSIFHSQLSFALPELIDVLRNALFGVKEKKMSKEKNWLYHSFLRERVKYF